MKFKAIRTVLKKFFVIEVCLLLSANINTVHFEQMFVKTLILLVISNNLAFQQVSSPGAGASVVTTSDGDFPPNVACFHRLPGKHWDYCTGLPSCFWSPVEDKTIYFQLSPFISIHTEICSLHNSKLGCQHTGHHWQLLSVESILWAYRNPPITHDMWRGIF